MKILHILNTSSYSGAENVVCQIIDMFRDDDNIEMAYVSPSGDIDVVLKKRGIKHISINKLNYSELKRIIKEEKPDIVHAHDFRASILATICNPNRVISHLHKNDPQLKHFSIKSFLYFISIHKYHKILVVSESIKNEFILSKPYTSRFMCVDNPIDVNKIREMSESVENSEFYDIGFVGRLEEPKNPLLFIDIVSRLAKKKPELKACVIGDGSLKCEVERLINKNKIDNNIILKGFIENPYPQIKNIKISCVPSLWEGFGLSAIEALALEKPVVCSGVGGLSGIIDESCGKICYTVEEYVDEILLLLDNDNYYLEKKKGARFRSENLNNIEKYKQLLKTIYYEKVRE